MKPSNPSLEEGEIPQRNPSSSQHGDAEKDEDSFSSSDDDFDRKISSMSEEEIEARLFEDKRVSMDVLGVEAGTVVYPKILSKKPKKAWSECLSRNGFEGLVFKNFELLESPGKTPYFIGIPLDYWSSSGNANGPISFTKVESPIPTSRPPGVYNHTEAFPTDTLISSIMATTGLIIESCAFLRLARAFRKLWYHPLSVSHPVISRTAAMRCIDASCFWAQYSQVCPEERWNEQSAAKYGHAFVAASDSETIKTFAEDTVITMTGIYREAHRKFRMHVGDIVIMKGGNPFALSLPTNARMKKSRMLAWTLSNRKPDSPSAIPAPTLMPIATIEKIIHHNETAMQFYTMEIAALEEEPKEAKDKGDISGYMERLRVTPCLYTRDEVYSRLEIGHKLYDVFHWISSTE